MRLFSFLVLLLSVSTAYALPQDSIRTEGRNGQLFVVHRVDMGETLYGLARRYNVSVDQIKKANDGLPSGLQAGSMLYVPTGKPAGSTPTASTKPVKTHTVKPGETLYGISRETGVSVDQIKQFNALTSNEISIDQVLYLEPKRAGTTVVAPAFKPGEDFQHTVGPGESLYGIANRYGITVQKIKEWNGLSNDLLSVGQTLNLRQSQIVPASARMAEEKSFTAPSSEPLRSQQEEGLALLKEVDGFGAPYAYGWHPTAPVGTIIKVTNPVTGKYQFVRIVGPLPNSKAGIGLNKPVWTALGGGKEPVSVRLTYFLP